MLSAAVAGGGGRVVWAMLVAVLTVLVTVLTPVGCAVTYYLKPNGCSVVNNHRPNGWRSHSGRPVTRCDFCSFKPKNSPESVECDLSNRREDSIIIKESALPKNIQRLRIVNANKVEVCSNALSVLDTLENIHFENITKLIVKGNAATTTQHQGHVSVTLNRISHVEMESSSFSHWEEKTLNISIANIDTCIIHGEAIVSSSSWSNVLIENITDGQFYTGTFTTTLGGLTLNNVTMTKPCKTKTFAGHIGKLSLTTVKFRSVEKGCFQASQNWSSLTVRSSHLGNISSHGLQGRIKDVRIEESSLGRIFTNGFDLDVSSLVIQASSIDALAKNALNVRATGWISILMSNVTTIDENAFRSLNSSQGIKLDQLDVGSVVNGSMRFSNVTSLTLHELQLQIPCECKIEKQVRELLFGRNLLSTQSKRNTEKLLRSAYCNIRCLHNPTTPLLQDYHYRNCPSRLEDVCDIAERNTGTDKTSSVSAVPYWIPLVAVFGCFLLLGAVITLLVIRHRRLSASRRRIPRSKRPPSQRLSVADIQHSLPDLQKDGQQMDSTSKSPGEERSGEVPQTVAAGSTVYSSVRAIVPEATVGAVCENVSGVSSADEQALYEEISPQGQTRGDEKDGFRAEPTQAPPLYAEVNKGKWKSATTSDDSRYAADSSDPPVYAQVNKTKARTIQRSGKITHQTASTGTSGTEAAGNVSEINATDDTTADMPVYAQVHTYKPDGKKRSVNKQAGHSELDQTTQSPVYAQLNKNIPTASSQTSRNDPSQQTWEPSDAPLYEEVSRLGPEESPLYADVMYCAAGSAESKENDDFSEGLHNNELYGVNMSPKG